MVIEAGMSVNFLIWMSHPVLPICLVYLPAYLVLILSRLSCSVVHMSCAYELCIRVVLTSCRLLSSAM